VSFVVILLWYTTSVTSTVIQGRSQQEGQGTRTPTDPAPSRATSLPITGWLNYGLEFSKLALIISTAFATDKIHTLSLYFSLTLRPGRTHPTGLLSLRFPESWDPLGHQNQATPPAVTSEHNVQYQQDKVSTVKQGDTRQCHDTASTTWHSSRHAWYRTVSCCMQSIESMQ